MKRVLVGGCFDLIHYGHIQFLKKAKNQGDYLIVALESDDNVKRKKGINRPLHTQTQRKRMLESLKMVDEVIMLPTMNSYDDYVSFVRKIKPDIIAVTENDPQLINKQKQAKEIGAAVIDVTPRINPHSTTRLIKELDL